MKKAWVISLLALGAFCGQVSPSTSVSSTPPKISIIPAAFAQARPVAFNAASMDDHFIHSFAARRVRSRIHPERRPALSNIHLSITPATLEQTLPRHAPGLGPNRVPKADRDLGVAFIGRVFISQHGLTVNLY